MLNDTIVKLKAAGQNVYLPLSPYTLVWAASMFGGRIVVSGGNSFIGYIDG
ncbi:hypothetical protein [Paenibacillus harenae]|uniref:Uncharacterized protein n=1 Tax=Paenibacillus harenae TaxID=306543 RepID=A0ABT9U779_PAEHA|nr:hypothetical protein [Paenibacillus harenae]MDQ0115504.1 hypothetical protein [Paenibacillus harenae]